MSSSILHIQMSGKNTDTGPPRGQPLIYLIKQLLAEKTISFIKFIINLLMIDFLHKCF